MRLELIALKPVACLIWHNSHFDGFWIMFDEKTWNIIIRFHPQEDLRSAKLIYIVNTLIS